MFSNALWQQPGTSSYEIDNSVTYSGNETMRRTPSSAGNIVFQHPSMNELGFYYNSFQGLPGDVNEPEEYNQYNTSLK